MIELELPCCGATASLPDHEFEVHCDGCGIVAELASDPEPIGAPLTPPHAGLPIATALAA